ncbi:hypothetical protein A2774_00760 [Candidatus Roizmanbacteria bacterium RIFCSPHIGHO2_01_FULL_39_12c]|uniref:Glycosyltransferase 2-like domain-containing protein n=1 Tax=Candidatus Roizmanbacteria bacterium RIFCSPHIGHO2_01_FULL_39_12c TaxID=1802031 RepID=A0A1F7GF62_9BACT|nr:MAG: hypothetical protein A2774_00760 [Candidatus Roizmanbacteria bacterium RIFCSPHIGHO2_01_FULL_39_12c]OGK46524.1 MAG: hypothetical protein A2963_02175 [Candidatus Roizmanbacteria bacterium RIFCSPLOWO2_01_FULL_40_13]
MSILVKKNTNITFIIFSFNEEKRILYPLKLYRPYGEILVVDNYSRDRTVQIAKSSGARVIRYRNKGWAESKNQMDFIFKHVKTEWLCICSADEIIPKSCLDLYCKIAEENKYKVVIQRKKTLLFKAGTDFIPAYINVHFFKKDSLDFTNKSVHERKFASHVKPDEVLYLPPIDEYSIYHFSVNTSEGMMKMLNSYSNVQAYHVSTDFIGLKLIIMPIVSFIRHYIFGKIFTIGLRGFIISLQIASFEFWTYAKAYELRNNINFTSIENSFAEEKRRLMKKSPKSGFLKTIWAKFIILLLARIHRWYKFRV